MKPVIFGLSGEFLTDDERALFRESEPAGYVFFARNISGKNQLRRLTDDLKDLAGRENLPILIDQEGGRVARMKPPVWPAFPAGAAFDKLYEVAPVSAIEAARANAHAIALTLAEMGVTVNALPLLDVRRPEGSDVIGDRALGSEPLRVAALGRAILEGMAEAGVAGIVKHMPGHGRARVDTHKHLPRVEASAEELETDLAPFKTLSWAPMGMSAHIVFTAWDPERPATLSPKVIGEIVRGEIGFDGLLFTDDLDMKALKGDPADLAAEAVAAGCDIALNCWGRFDEMKRTVERLPDIAEKSRERLDWAMEGIRLDREGNIEELVAKRDQLLALA